MGARCSCGQFFTIIFILISAFGCGKCVDFVWIMLPGLIMGIWLFIVVNNFIAWSPLLFLLFGQIVFGTSALYTLIK